MSSDDDRDAFAAAMRGVRRLHHKPKVPKATRAKTAGRPRSRAAHEAASAAVIDDKLRRAGVTEPKWRQFRRGKIPVTAEIDLHGYAATAADAALDEFLEECRARGVQCARIIHGKGRRSGPDGPVLKGIVQDKLTRSAEVLAFAPADARHGGSGAVLVLFRG